MQTSAGGCLMPSSDGNRDAQSGVVEICALKLDTDEMPSPRLFVAPPGALSLRVLIFVGRRCFSNLDRPRRTYRVTSAAVDPFGFFGFIASA